jgi:nitrile hydratase alpha subunit
MMDVTHTHDGPDPHAPRPDHDDTMTHHKMLEIAVRELLIEKGILTADEIREAIERMDARGPHLGAKLVARAWVDPAFKQRLLEDGGAAAEEAGVQMDTPTRLIVVENTPAVHNLVVCTLCSCYPRMVLGIPPDWYKSRAYRSRAVHEPRAVLAEFGTKLPDSVAVRVHDSNADLRYLVLPMRPQGTENLDEGALAALVTRDAMIGVTTL